MSSRRGRRTIRTRPARPEPSTARRVLPIPPGPTSVTSRHEGSSRRYAQPCQLPRPPDQGVAHSGRGATAWRRSTRQPGERGGGGARDLVAQRGRRRRRARPELLVEQIPAGLVLGKGGAPLAARGEEPHQGPVRLLIGEPLHLEHAARGVDPGGRVPPVAGLARRRVPAARACRRGPRPAGWPPNRRTRRRPARRSRAGTHPGRARPRQRPPRRRTGGGTETAAATSTASTQTGAPDESHTPAGSPRGATAPPGAACVRTRRRLARAVASGKSLQSSPARAERGCRCRSPPGRSAAPWPWPRRDPPAAARRARGRRGRARGP